MAIQTTLKNPSPFNSIQENILAFSRLPYKASPYSSRNWGHKWHSLCSYPSKLKPSIAHFLIKYFSKPDDTVLDPLSGVGTVPFEACLNGRIGMGIDLNPLAFHTTYSKVCPLSKDDIMKEFKSLTKIVLNDNESIEYVPEEIKEFFHKQTLQEIVNARSFLLQEFEREPRVSISFILSNIAHILHGNRPYALSRRSHNVIPIPPKGEFRYKPLLKHTKERIEDYIRVKFPDDFKDGKAIHESIFEFEMKNESVDVIITSPPFFGNTEFLRQNRVRIWFCGWEYQKQSEMKAEFIDYMDLSVYVKIFKKLYNILKNEGLCILHLGVVKEKDMALLVLPHAEKQGFQKVGLIYEDTSRLENHGRTARGGTHKHQFLILRK